MIELRPIVFILGILLSVLAVAMVIPAIVDIAVGHPDWQVFLTAAFVTLFVGVSMMLTTRASLGRFSVRQAFVMTNLAWFVIVLFGALPRSEEHTSELQSLMRISYAVFCLKKKKLPTKQ